MSAPACKRRVGAADRFFQPEHGARIRARDDEEIRIGAGRHRRAHLGEVFVERDDHLVVEMAALLREALILDMQAGDAAPLVFADGARGIELVAIAGVGIGDHRHVDRGRDAPGIVGHLRHGHEAVVRVAERRGRAGAGHVDGRKARLRDGARRNAVIGARRHDHVLLQKCAQFGSPAHGVLRSDFPQLSGNDRTSSKPFAHRFHAPPRGAAGSTMKQRKTFRALIAQNRYIVAPGAFDTLTARLVQLAGFEAVYLTGGGYSRANGYPDLGLLTLDRNHALDRADRGGDRHSGDRRRRHRLWQCAQCGAHGARVREGGRGGISHRRSARAEEMRALRGQATR